MRVAKVGEAPHSLLLFACFITMFPKPQDACYSVARAALEESYAFLPRIVNERYLGPSGID